MKVNLEDFPWCIVYSTPYGDEVAIALFQSKDNALRVCKEWSKDTQDDEDLEVRRVSDEDIRPTSDELVLTSGE